MNRSVTAELRQSLGQNEIESANLEPKDTAMSKSEKNGLLLWLFLGLLLPLLGMAPMFVLQAQSLFSQPRYMFAPFPIALGAGLLLATCKYRIARGARAKVAMGLAILGISIAVLGTFLFSPWIVQFASVVVVFAWALGAFAGTSWTRVFSICCLFAISVPPPGRIDSAIFSRLYSMIGWICNGFLDAIAVPNIFEGSTLQATDLKIKLPEVLGGVDGLPAFMAIGMAIVVCRRCTLLVSVAMLVFAAPLCYILSGTIRVLAIAIGHEYFGWDLSTGSGYIFTSVIVTFGAVLSLLLSYISLKAVLETIEGEKRMNNVTALYRLLSSWPNSRQWTQSPSADTPIPFQGKQTILVALPSLVCLLFGGLAGYVLLINARASIAKTGFTEAQVASLPSQSAFPAQIGSMRMVGFVPTSQTDPKAASQFSHLWKFEDKGGQVFVILDFPIQGWRPVWSGYQASGWKIFDVKPVDIPAEVAYPNLRVEEFEMQNQYGLYGYVWYAFFDEQGVPTSQTDDEVGGRTNIFARLKTKADTSSKSYLQVQLFLESGRELTELETKNNRKLFFEVYELLRSQSQAGLSKAK